MNHSPEAIKWLGKSVCSKCKLIMLNNTLTKKTKCGEFFETRNER